MSTQGQPPVPLFLRCRQGSESLGENRRSRRSGAFEPHSLMLVTELWRSSHHRVALLWRSSCLQGDSSVQSCLPLLCRLSSRQKQICVTQHDRAVPDYRNLAPRGHRRPALQPDPYSTRTSTTARMFVISSFLSTTARITSREDETNRRVLYGPTCRTRTSTHLQLRMYVPYEGVFQCKHPYCTQHRRARRITDEKACNLKLS